MSDLKRRLADLQKKHAPVRQGIIRKEIPGLVRLTRSGRGAAVAILEAGLPEGRTRAIIEEVKRLLPGLTAVIIIPDNGREPVAT